MSIFKKIALGIVPVFGLFLGGAVASLGAFADTTSNELIVNGEFDTGISSWTESWIADSGSGVGGVQGYDTLDCDGYNLEDPSGSLKLFNPSVNLNTYAPADDLRGHQCLGQKVYLEKGKLYSLSAMLKTDGVVSVTRAYTGAFVQIVYQDAVDCTVGYYKTADATDPNATVNKVVIGTNDWTAFSERFVATQTGEYTVYARLWGACGTLWVDNVSLQEIGKTELKDGTFSNADVSAWKDAYWDGATGSAKAERVSDTHTADGSGALKITTDSNSPHTYVGTKVYLPKGIYKVSGYIKTDELTNCTEGARFGYRLADVVASPNFICGPTGTLGDWTLYSGYFTAEEEGEYVITCMLWSAVGSAYFDDVTLEKVASTPTLSFKACNLALKDNVNLMFAVDGIEVAPEQIKVLVWNEPQTEYRYGTEDVELVYDSEKTVTIGGISYPVFTHGLSAKQMTDVVYVRAYANTKNGVVYSEPLKYSILEYAYNKLGYTDKEATTDEDLKTLLNDMLTYGASAQKYQGYKLDSLATDAFTYVRLEYATFADGFHYGLFKEGTDAEVEVEDGYRLDYNASEYFERTDSGLVFSVPNHAENSDKIIVSEDWFYAITGYDDPLNANEATVAQPNGTLYEAGNQDYVTKIVENVNEKYVEVTFERTPNASYFGVGINLTGTTNSPWKGGLMARFSPEANCLSIGGMQEIGFAALEQNDAFNTDTTVRLAYKLTYGRETVNGVEKYTQVKVELWQGGADGALEKVGVLANTSKNGEKWYYDDEEEAFIIDLAFVYENATCEKATSYMPNGTFIFPCAFNYYTIISPETVLETPCDWKIVNVVVEDGYNLDYAYSVEFAQDRQWVILNENTYNNNNTVAYTVKKNAVIDANVVPTFTFADPTVARLEGNTLIGLKTGVTTLTAEYKGQKDTMRVEVLEKLGSTVTATDSSQVRSFGRGYEGASSERLRFVNTASGFEVNFIGSQLTCQLDFNVYEPVTGGLDCGLKIYLDGEVVNYYKSNVDKTEAVTLVDGISYGFHTVKVMKMTEQALLQCEVWGLTTDGTFVTPFAQKELMFEFYGDSITCGYGNLPNSEGMAYAQDGTNTYASIASEYFNADYECVSYSGLAVSLPQEGVSYTVEDIFDRYNEQNRNVYDMSKTDPDVVVVSLGTNDSFGLTAGGNGALVKKYVEFIKALRAKRPNAPIICIYGLMWIGGNELETENGIKLAMEELHKDGIDKVYYSRVTSNITGKDDHPDSAGHQSSGEQLINLIKKYGELDGYLLENKPAQDDAQILCTGNVTQNVRYGDTVIIPLATAIDYDRADLSANIRVDIGRYDEHGKLLQWEESYMQADAPMKSFTVKEYPRWVVRYTVMGTNGNTVVKTLRFTAMQSTTPTISVANSQKITATVGETITLPGATAISNGVDISANIEVWVYRLNGAEKELVEIFATGGTEMEAQLTSGSYELLYKCKDGLGNSAKFVAVEAKVSRQAIGTNLISESAIAKNNQNATWNNANGCLDVGATSTSANSSYSQVTFDNDKYGMDDIIKVTFSIDGFVDNGEAFYTMGSFASKTYHEYMPSGHEATWPPFFSIRISKDRVSLVTGLKVVGNPPYMETLANLGDGNQHTIAWQITKTGTDCNAEDASIVMKCWIDCEPTSSSPSLQLVCTSENYEKVYFDKFYNEGDGWLYFGSISNGPADDCMHVYKAELCE